MKSIILILITTLLFICCSNNPLKNTQWEVIPGALDDLQLISFDEDTCAFYVLSSINGKSSIIGLNYDVKGNVVKFSPINIRMESYPTFIIDGNFLIFEYANKPTLKRIAK